MCGGVTHRLFSVRKDRGQRCDHHCLYAQLDRRLPDRHGPNRESRQQVQPLHNPRAVHRFGRQRRRGQLGRSGQSGRRSDRELARQRQPQRQVNSWENAWGEFVPFLEFPAELRKIVYTTNAIESLNARFRRAVRHRGHFPNEQAALKVLYLVATTRRKNRENMTGRTNGWKQILNALTVHYGDRITNINR